MQHDNRDSIDLGTMNITKLFSKYFFPTLFGMLATTTIVLADGIFVGKGTGSEGLAAVNIVAPLFMVVTGLGLMFGIGSSVVSSIHMSKNNNKAANINVTQAFIVGILLMAILISSLYIFSGTITNLLGSTPQLQSLVLEYLYFIAPGFMFTLIQCIGLFIIRLDGSPKYAMMCSVFPGIVNVILDYTFIFPLGMGLKGAALASTIAMSVSGLMVFSYFGLLSKTIHFYKLKLSKKSIVLTARNIGYQMRLGSPALLGETAISVMILVGNYVFTSYLGSDGVAAYSVACYCFPIMFMISNAVVQSAQPIVSYNHGAGNECRVNESFKLMISAGSICSIIATALIIAGNSFIVGMFLDSSCNAYKLAVYGMPYFALGFLFFAFNMSCIGFFQSIEKAKRAIVYAVLRGFVFLIISFLALPYLFGEIGIWLAVPVAEMAAAATIIVIYLKSKKCKD